MAQNYVCPGCGYAISHDDINVPKDIAFCRNCGKTSVFSTLAGASEFADVDINLPPKHVKLKRDIMGNLILLYKKRSGALFFFIPFTLFWSGLSMGGIYGTQVWEGEFDLAQSLFGIPFLIGTIVLVNIIIFMLFGRWEISLGDGEGRVFVGVGRFGWTRIFEYNSDSTVTLKTTNIRVNDVPQKGICVDTYGKDFVFGTGISDESKSYIAAVINSIVQQKPRY